MHLDSVKERSFFWPAHQLSCCYAIPSTINLHCKELGYRMQRNGAVSTVFTLLECSVMDLNQSQNGCKDQFLTATVWECSGMCGVEEEEACMLERSHQDGLGYNHVIFIISQLTKNTSMWVWFVDSCGGPCICSRRRKTSCYTIPDWHLPRDMPGPKNISDPTRISVLYTAETNISRPALAVTYQQNGLDQSNVILEVQADPTARRKQKTLIMCRNCNRPVSS
jgi:hypothetical protein